MYCCFVVHVDSCSASIFFVITFCDSREACKSSLYLSSCLAWCSLVCFSAPISSHSLALLACAAASSSCAARNEAQSANHTLRSSHTGDNSLHPASAAGSEASASRSRTRSRCSACSCALGSATARAGWSPAAQAVAARCPRASFGLSRTEPACFLPWISTLALQLRH